MVEHPYIHAHTYTHSYLFGGGLVTRSYPTIVTPWTVAHQDPLFMGFPRQEYLSGLPFPSLGDLPNSGIEPTSAL